MKIRNPRSEIRKLVLFILCSLVIAPMAMAGTLTKEGSADFSNGSFSDTRVSGEVVVLGVTPEAQWTTGGLKLNSVSTNGRRDVKIAGDSSGGVWVAWADDRRSIDETDIYAAHVLSNGTKTEFAVESSDQNMGDLDLAQSINGSSTDGMIVAYCDESGESVKAKKFNTLNVEQWGSFVFDGNNKPYQPDLASDHSGGAVFVWQDWEDQVNGAAIMAKKLDSTGAMPVGQSWITNGVTICSAVVNPVTNYPKRPRIIPLKATGNEGYIVTWEDTREGFPDIYSTRITDAGVVQTAQFGSNGSKISNSGLEKDEPRYVATLTYNGVMTVYDQVSVTNLKNIVAQLIQGDGEHWNYGSSGLTLNASAGQLTKGNVATLPDYEMIFSWLDLAGSGANYLQRMTGYATPEWGSGGKAVGGASIVDLTYDRDDGAYALAVTGTEGDAVPHVQRINPDGDLLWGNGVAVASYGIIEVNFFQMIACDDLSGLIVVWIDDRTSNRDVYAQKYAQKFKSSGSFTTAKIENNASDFAGWETMSWTSTDLSGEVKTAATSAGLDSASWQDITNGGAITSHGKWLQARFSFAAGAGQATSPKLASFTLNFSGSTISSSPEISVKIGGVELSSGDYVPSSPTIVIKLTDDEQIASFGGLTLDSNPVPYTTVSTSAAEWNLQASPTISEGTHTLALSATDSDGNTTSRSYTIKREAGSSVAGGSVKALASGSNLTIGYELTAPARVKITIRDIKGSKVKEVFADANTAGGSAGYNAVDIDVGNLSIGVYLIYITPTGGTPSIGKFSISQ